MIPQDLKFTKTHEWAKLDADTGTVTIGLTDFAIEQLGDIVFVELPAAGQSVTQATPFGVIESVKAAVDLESPVSGEVTEANEALPEELDTLAEDPYGKGWMIKIKATDLAQLDSLMSPAEYENYLESPECQH